MKVMISQPMKDREEVDIKKERQQIIEKFNKMHIEVIDTLFTEEAPKDCNTALYYLGKSIDAMKDIDALYMCENWSNNRGCRIEKEVAKEYGIKILDKSFFSNDAYYNTLTIKGTDILLTNNNGIRDGECIK